MPKNNKLIFVLIILVIAFLVFKYNTEIFSTVDIDTSGSKVTYETTSCSDFLAKVTGSGWSYSCDKSSDNCNINFVEAKLPWKYSNNYRCINSMDDENNKCKIVYTEGECK